jgi:hypothetical protein
MFKRVVGWLSGLVLFAILDELLGILIPDKAINLVFAAMLTLMFIGLVLVAYGTYARNRWGINFQHFDCARCHAPMPKVRKPRSRREMFWGGNLREMRL